MEETGSLHCELPPPAAKQQSRTNAKHKCNYCNKTFPNKCELNYHVNIHTNEKPYKCGKCDRQFLNPDALSAHKYAVHEPRYQCDICNTKFSYNSNLHRHRKIHSEVNRFRKCEICSKSVRDLKSHMQTHAEKRFSCTYCPAKFRRNCYLTDHVRVHTGEKPYECQFCKKSFATQTHRAQHEQRSHTEDKRHKCQYCEKTFFTIVEKKQHERVHTGEKPFGCSFCQIKCASKTRLNQHMQRNHIKEKSHDCQFCPKSFVTNADKKEHERIHTGEKPYKCELCQKLFIKSSDRSSHIRRVHEKEKRFKCEFCSKDFFSTADKKNM